MTEQDKTPVESSNIEPEVGQISLHDFFFSTTFSELKTIGVQISECVCSDLKFSYVFPDLLSCREKQHLWREKQHLWREPHVWEPAEQPSWVDIDLPCDIEVDPTSKKADNSTLYTLKGWVLQSWYHGITNSFKKTRSFRFVFLQEKQWTKLASGMRTCWRLAGDP